jgi:uncharacterized protein YndB with AHSA1/START domain
MPETETAVFATHINATKEEVWRELTRTDAPQDAMYHAVLHTTGLKPGASYQMRTPNGKYVTVVGEILEYNPPVRLRQTVRFVKYDDPPVIVTYDIADSADGGVDLTLTVENIPVGTKTGDSWTGSGGGNWVCKTIKEIVEDGQTSLSTRIMYRMWDTLGPLLAPIANPKHTRAENWPLDH